MSARHISRTRTVAQVMSLSSRPRVRVHVSVSPRLALSLYLTHFLPHSFHLFLHLKPWTRRRSSPTKGFPRTPNTMTLHSRVCFAKLTEYIAITLNEKTCLSVCRRRQCPTERGDLLETERGDPLSKETRKHRLGLCSTNKKSRFLPSARQRINRHDFQAAYDRRSLLKLGAIVESQKEELHCARAEEVQQRDQQLLQGQLLQQNLELREAHQRSLSEMEELRKFQSSTFDTIARRKLVEDQNTVLELSGRIQELQNEINCMSDSKEFQDAESIRSGNSHVTSRPVSFPPHPIPGGMLSRFFLECRAAEKSRQALGTHMENRETFFANPVASSSAPHPQELNQWSSSIEEPLHSSTVEKSERQEQNQDLRCQPGSSAKDSVIFSGGDSSKNYGAGQQRLQISDLHFDKFPTPATFACWKIRFKTEVCICSQFPTEAMQWIKEVEMVDSVDDLRSSLSV